MDKVIVAGSRSIEDKQIVKQAIIDSPHSPFHGELVVGDAEGVDKTVKEYLSAYVHVDIIEFKADWERYGASAGPIRNKEMAEYADGLIAIWDGESHGTKNMIDNAMKEGLDVYIKTVDIESKDVFDY